MDRREFLVDLTRAAALCAVVPNVWRVTTRSAVRRRSVHARRRVGRSDADRRRAVDAAGAAAARAGGRHERPAHRRHRGKWPTTRPSRSIVKTGPRHARRPSWGTASTSTSTDSAADRWYFYRFSARRRARVPSGGCARRRPRPRSRRSRFAFVSCQHWEQGLYTAYEHLAREELDLVAHLGDYIYEYGANPTAVRQHASPEVRTLDRLPQPLRAVQDAIRRSTRRTRAARGS